MTKKKPIVIKTIADIFQVVTEENADRFATDFYLFLKQSAKCKKEVPEIYISAMEWVDDGTHEITAFSLNGASINFFQKR
jgi:kynurenine formamidase